MQLLIRRFHRTFPTCGKNVINSPWPNFT